MGILDKLKARPQPRASLPRKASGAKHYTITVQQDADGFIPALQFTGSNLEILLTRAIWAYVCITRIAEDIAGMPAVIQVKDGKDWRTDPDHPLTELLIRPFGPQAPNGRTLPKWSWRQVLEVISIHKHMTGNAYLLQVKPTGNARRLIALQLFGNPHAMKVDPDPDTKAAALYRYGGVEYQPEQIVNIMTPTPSSFYKGISPLEAANKAISIDYQAQERIQADLTQRIAPGLIVTVDGLWGADPDQRAEIEDILIENFGTAEKSGLPYVVGDGTKVEKSPAPDYLKDLPEHRKQAAKEMWAIFKIPPPVAGDMDAATLQNAQVALRLYWMQALQPQIGRILDQINTQAVYPTYGYKTRIGYELGDNELGLAVVKERATIAKTLTDIGFSANDSAARVSLGMDPRPELDQANTRQVVAGRGTDQSSSEESPPQPASSATA